MKKKLLTKIIAGIMVGGVLTSQFGVRVNAYSDYSIACNNVANNKNKYSENLVNFSKWLLRKEGYEGKRIMKSKNYDRLDYDDKTMDSCEPKNIVNSNTSLNDMVDSSSDHITSNRDINDDSVLDE